jgi:hypothetical protein
VTPRRQLTGIGAAVAIIVVGGGIMLWSLWPADPDAAAVMVNGRLVADATGYVARVDPVSREVQISGSVLGFRPWTVVVADETAIVVRGKQGSFGDLVVDMPVHVTYVLDKGTRRATSVEFQTPGSPTMARVRQMPPAPDVRVPPASVGEDEVEPTPSAEPARVGATQATTAPAATSPPKPAAAEPVRRERPVATTAPTTAPAATSPAKPAPAGPVRRERPVATTVPAPVPAAMPSAAATPRAPGPRPDASAEQGAGDGSAVIDWLLDTRRR